MARISTFITAVRCEWRLLRFDPALWLVLALMLATVGYALYNGHAAVARYNNSVAAALADEQQRLASLTQNLTAIEAGTAAPPDRPFRDPRNALFMGGDAAATTAVLPLQPLALAAVGQSDLYPPTLRVSAGSRDSFFFSDEIANPAHLLSGSFDLAFVLVFLYPLFILTLTYNLISGEREQGTLALTASCPVSLRDVLAGKMLVRAGVPILFMLIVVLVGLTLMTGAALLNATAALMMLVIAVTFYGLFWAALAAAINSLGRDSAHNALLLVTAWVVLLFIVPALINAWSQARYPSPSRAEMVTEVRAASIDADRERDATLARYQEEHGHLHDDGLQPGSYRERTLRRLAVQQAATQRAEAIMSVHDERLQQQHLLANRLAYLSPALLMYNAVAEIAGTGQKRYTAFFDQVEQFHLRWRDFFISRAQAEIWLTSADYKQLPQFIFSESDSPSVLSRLLPSMVGIGLLLIFISAVAVRSLKRCRVVI